VVGDVAYDKQLDQSMGDTCHHYKGDTWHWMTSAGDWVGTVVGYVADTWSIRHLTLGSLLLIVEVPRGTLWLVRRFCIKFYGFTRVEPLTFLRAVDW
jgi:hypothetical protein